MKKATVIGTTSWGTSLAIMLAERGIDAFLWSWTEEEASQFKEAGENILLLPGFPFPQGLTITGSLEKALEGADLVIFVVPSKSMRENVKGAKDYLRDNMIIVSAAKGLEAGTDKRMSQVIEEEVDEHLHHRICVLSGPTLAKEVARGLPATAVIAAEEEGMAREAQSLLMSPRFRVYTSNDVVGVELGGAFKNIIAIGAGLCDGLGYGHNAKAALIARGLAEITRLGVAAGGQPSTFTGLAGLGDLVVTCSSPLSRNHFVGEQLAKGQPLKEILASLGLSVAEGIDTTAAARKMAQDLGVEMPITEHIYRVLFERLDPRQAVAELMGRPPKAEMNNPIPPAPPPRRG